MGVTPPFWGYLLSCELVGPHGDAIDELHGTPEPVEFHALVHVHDAVGGWRAPPDRVLQVAPDAGQDALEHGQSTAQSLLGQQVALPSNGDLLGRGEYTNLPVTSQTPFSTLTQDFQTLKLAASVICSPELMSCPEQARQFINLVQLQGSLWISKI